jgi:hypothetical protein
VPDQPKTPARSFRFSDEELALMDRLADHFTTHPERPYKRTDVLKIALNRLAEQELGKSQKKR